VHSFLSFTPPVLKKKKKEKELKNLQKKIKKTNALPHAGCSTHAHQQHQKTRTEERRESERARERERRENEGGAFFFVARGNVSSIAFF
tara:strand:- start:200 stop:466 length:267 start_codon:yes stop_codon:yes gene_type:complete